MANPHHFTPTTYRRCHDNDNDNNKTTAAGVGDKYLYHADDPLSYANDDDHRELRTSNKVQKKSKKSLVVSSFLLTGTAVAMAMGVVGVINIILSHGMLSKSWAGAGEDVAVASPVVTNSTSTVLSSLQAFRQPAVHVVASASPIQVAEESRKQKLNFVGEMAMNVDEAGNKTQLVIYRTYRDASWRSKPIYMNAIEVTQQNVPGATQIVFTDADIEKWMEEHFPSGTPEHGAFHSIHPQWGVARSDLWRLLVIWVHGGLYLDMKSVARGAPPPLEGKMISTRWRIRTSCNYHVQVDEVINWYVYAPKGSPVLRHLIDAIINNLKAEQSNTRSNEYHKLVGAESCDSEAKARVLYTTGARAVTLALEKMPAHLQQLVTESNTNGQNPTLRKQYNIDEFRPDFPALDGAVEYGDKHFESGAHSHILVEGSNHYTTFVGVPLTSRTSHSAEKQYVSTDQQWDVVIFAPTPPGAYSGDTHRLRQFIRFFVEQGLKTAVVVHARDRAILSREDWTRMIYSPSKEYDQRALVHLRTGDAVTTGVIEWLDIPTAAGRVAWVPCFLDDSPDFASAINVARAAKVVVVGVWFWGPQLATMIPKDVESKTIFLSDDIHYKRCFATSEPEYRCNQMKLEEVSMWKERQGLWASITDADSFAVQNVRPKSFPIETLPYLVESDPQHRRWKIRSLPIETQGSMGSSDGIVGGLHPITIVYTGGPHPANVVALRWFISTAMPTFIDLIGGSTKVHLHVTGRGWGDGWGLLHLFERESKPGWLNSGSGTVSFSQVEDVAETLLACDAVIIPDRATTSGVTTKVFDPIVIGAPFVATAPAQRGLICPPTAHCDSLFFCPLDDPGGECFAKRLLAIINDPEFVQRQQSALTTLRNANGAQRWKGRPIFHQFLNDRLSVVGFQTPV